MVIRAAVAEDAAAVRAIYAPYVEKTAISFELEVPSFEEIVRRIAAAKIYLVYELEGAIAGYAYAGTFRERPAYRFTVETSVYVDREHHRRGLAHALYERLFDELRARGFHTAIAAITLPSDASVAFHERFGFTPIGVLHEVGFKFDRWWDTGWFERRI